MKAEMKVYFGFFCLFIASIGYTYSQEVQIHPKTGGSSDSSLYLKERSLSISTVPLEKEGSRMPIKRMQDTTIDYKILWKELDGKESVAIPNAAIVPQKKESEIMPIPDRQQKK